MTEWGNDNAEEADEDRSGGPSHWRQESSENITPADWDLNTVKAQTISASGGRDSRVREKQCLKSKWEQNAGQGWSQERRERMALKQGQYGLAKEQARDRGLTNDPRQTGPHHTFRSGLRVGFFTLMVVRSHVIAPHPKPTASLKTCTYTFYSRITRTAKQSQVNHSVIPTAISASIIYFLDICVNTIMHQIFEPAIKRVCTVIQGRNMILIFHILKLLNL